MGVANIENKKLLGTIFMGSDRQEFSVILDTGSSKLIVMDRLSCTECTGQTFDASTSDTYVDSGTVDEIHYID